MDQHLKCTPSNFQHCLLLFGWNCVVAGYYPAGAPPKSNAQAQIDMIDETLKWAGVSSVKSVSAAGRVGLQQFRDSLNAVVR